MGDLVRTVLLSILLISISVGISVAVEPPVVLQNGHQSLVSDFHADVTSGQAPTLIQFYDTSEGAPGEWLWNFGDGDEATVKNPLHIYTKPGIYSVTLVITGPSGSDRKTRLGYISVSAGEESVSPSSAPVQTPNPAPTPILLPTESITPVSAIPPEPIPLTENLSTPLPEPSHVPTGGTPDSIILNMFGEKVHAGYTPSSSGGLVPLTVQFTDSSSGNPTSWLWDFGDGNTSDVASPEHVYANPGNYSVRLTVKGANSTDSLFRMNSIEAALTPAVSILAQPRSGSAPLTVAFTDNSTGRINSRIWSFGDGTQSEEKNPVHMFTKPGVYDVSLAISGPDGQAENRTPSLITVTDLIEPPKASIGVEPPTGTSPLTIRLTDTSTGDVTTRNWDFGDGTTASEMTLSHIYQKAGTYTVTLLIKGPSGESQAQTQIIVNGPVSGAIAGITAAPLNGPAPLTVSFTDASTGEITSRIWDFGDGQVSSEVSPSHTYTSAGTYPVVLTVTGPGGENKTTTTASVVEPVSLPEAGFTAVPLSGSAPLTISFTDGSTGEITSRNWNFGDGQVSSEVSPSHTYTSAGTYPVVLTVTGPGGENKTTTTVSVVEPVSLPKAGFTAIPLSGPAPLTVSFTDGSTGEIISRNWNFGDGQVSSEVSPSHTYASPGSYPVVLTVTGPGGENKTTTTVSVVEPVSLPKAGFTAVPLSGPAPLMVSFTDGSTGEIISRSWTFGDGQVSGDVSPSHTYSSAGTYPVVLTVTGPNGENTSQSAVTVTEETVPVLTSFTTDVHEGLGPLTVQFTDTSTGMITSQTWNFGDGTTGTGLNTAHTYTEAGTYTAILTTVSQTGENTAETTITVTKPTGPPVASFTADKTTGGVPLLVNFLDSSSGEIETRTWNYGDGTTGTGKTPSHSYQKAGQHQVTLTVAGPSGESSHQEIITVNDEVLPFRSGFIVSRNEGSAPFTVSFTDSSTGNITTRNWDFGDGSSSAEQNPSHTYTAAGNYPVSLTIYGPEGERHSDISLILVTASVAPPKALFTLDVTTGAAPLTVSFVDASTGDITGRSWTFGDDSSSSDQQPTHVFTKPGVFSVSLNVKGPAGESSLAKTITVRDPAAPVQNETPVNSSVMNLTPVVTGQGENTTLNLTTLPSNLVSIPGIDFIADKTEGTAPLMVTFHPSSANQSDGYLWDLGDGNISYDANPAHLYSESGSYDVILTISGPAGVLTKKKTGFITISTDGGGLKADFSSDIQHGAAPLPVTFSSPNTTNVDRYEWLFGDGMSSGEPNPVHTYEKPGKYDVTLTISGKDGKDTQVQPAYITVDETAAPLQVLVNAATTTGSAPLVINFSSAVSGPVQSYLWTFGDNSTSAEENPIHTYLNPGSYDVSLQVQGASGIGTGNLKTPVMVSAAPDSFPISLHADLTNGTAPLKISFTAETNGSFDGYAWDFGDGGSSYDQQPVHVYNIAGNYSVKLVVAGKNGSYETRLPESIIIHEGEKIPVSGFTGSPTSGYAPLNVTFSDLSSGSNREYLWDFGDGSTSVKGNPNHIYTKPGIYTVKQQVVSDAGRSEEVKEGYVTVQERPQSPVARFKSDLRSGNSPLVVKFSDFSSGVITGWNWDLGDGNQSTETNPVHTYVKPGVFTVSQTVTGPGGENTVVHRGFITVNQASAPPVAAIYAEPLEGVEPLTVRFLDVSKGSVTGWTWDFGDGTNSTNKNPTHIYQHDGTYQVKLVVSGPGGSDNGESEVRVSAREKGNNIVSGQDISTHPGTGNETGTVSVVNPGKPMANFSLSKRNGLAPLEISFQDRSSGQITGWNWDFGDTTISEIQNPVHTYKKPGIYTVGLTVTGSDGRSGKRIRDAIQVY